MRRGDNGFNSADFESSGDENKSPPTGSLRNIPENSKKLYCLCMSEYKGGSIMFQCEGACNGWYHPKCVGISDE